MSYAARMIEVEQVSVQKVAMPARRISMQDAVGPEAWQIRFEHEEGKHKGQIYIGVQDRRGNIEHCFVTPERMQELLTKFVRFEKREKRKEKRS